MKTNSNFERPFKKKKHHPYLTFVIEDHHPCFIFHDTKSDGSNQNQINSPKKCSNLILIGQPDFHI